MVLGLWLPQGLRIYGFIPWERGFHLRLSRFRSAKDVIGSLEGF